MYWSYKRVSDSRTNTFYLKLLLSPAALQTRFWTLARCKSRRADPTSQIVLFISLNKESETQSSKCALLPHSVVSGMVITLPLTLGIVNVY